MVEKPMQMLDRRQAMNRSSQQLGTGCDRFSRPTTAGPGCISNEDASTKWDNKVLVMAVYRCHWSTRTTREEVHRVEIQIECESRYSKT